MLAIRSLISSMTRYYFVRCRSIAVVPRKRAPFKASVIPIMNNPLNASGFPRAPRARSSVPMADVPLRKSSNFPLEDFGFTKHPIPSSASTARLDLVTEPLREQGSWRNQSLLSERGERKIETEQLPSESSRPKPYGVWQYLRYLRYGNREKTLYRRIRVDKCRNTESFAMIKEQGCFSHDSENGVYKPPTGLRRFLTAARIPVIGEHMHSVGMFRRDSPPYSSATSSLRVACSFRQDIGPESLQEKLVAFEVYRWQVTQNFLVFWEDIEYTLRCRSKDPLWATHIMNLRIVSVEEIKNALAEKSILKQLFPYGDLR